MKIVYVANTRLPTEKAHGLALMKLCEAFAREGAEVEVVAPRLLRLSKKDPYHYYGVKQLFPIYRVPSLDLHPLKTCRRALYTLQMVTFSFFAMRFCARRYSGQRVVYMSHDYMPLYFLSFLRAPVYYDIHHFPGNNFMYRRVLQRACGVAVQTKWKIGALGRLGVPEAKIAYWPNGTDVSDFAIDEGALKARKSVGLGAQGPVVLYAGQFFPWKGVDTLLRAAPMLPPGAHLVMVGGAKEDIDRLRREVPESALPHVRFVPWVQRASMPHWLRAADVVVLPNTGTKKVSLYYTSPMKLFEYMASARPIVASRLPSIEEVVGPQEAYLVDPDDPRALAEGIAQALGPHGSARGLAAREKARGFTWQARAKALLPHMRQCAQL